MSLASASVTTCASSPSTTARACAPDPPCEVWMSSAGWPGGLPVGVERLVELPVELAGRVVGDVEQRGRLRLAGRPSACRQRQKRREPDAAQAAGEPPADLAPGGGEVDRLGGVLGAPAGGACRTCRSELARAPDARRSPPVRRSASSTSGSQDWPWSSVGLPLLRQRPLGRVRSLARAAPVGDLRRADPLISTEVIVFCKKKITPNAVVIVEYYSPEASSCGRIRSTTSRRRTRSSRVSDSISSR